MGGDGFSGLHQLLQQCVAEQQQLRLGPQRPQVDKQGLPTLGQQRLPQRRGCAQQSAVFVKQGQCIAQRAAHRPHAVGGDVLRLQLVQPALGAGKLVPHQAIEKIMQALPHRALLAAENKALVGFSGGQGILWHKGHRRTRWPSAGIERLMQSPPAHHLLRHLLPDAGPRRQPGGLPIDATQTMRHGSVSPLRSGLSSAWPKAKDSGGVQASRCRVICPVLRGRR